MALRIDLHDHETPYIAGYTVNGTVRLTGTSDIDVGRITIAFFGRCKSKIVVSRGQAGTDYYRGRVLLFRFEKVLFEGPRTLHPNQHSWDFTFRFPTRCQSQTGDRFQRSAAFDADPDQPLPASFALFERGWTQRISGYVSYELEARLVKHNPKLFTPRSSVTLKRLTLLSTRDVADPNPQLFSQQQSFDCRSLHLLPGNEDRSLTFKEKLHSTFRSSTNLPLARFQLDVEMPQVGVLGQALPIFLGIDHDIEHSTAKAPPAVYLRHVRVTVEARGAIRCINEQLLSLSHDDRVGSWDDTLTLAQDFGTGSSSVAVTERMDLRELMRLNLDHQELTPSFSTFNHSVLHMLRVKVVVECAQKTFKAEWGSRRLDILPQLYRAPDVTDGDTTRDSDIPVQEERYDASPREEEFIPPPLYTSAAPDTKADG